MISNYKMVKNKHRMIKNKVRKNNSLVTLSNKEKVCYNGQIRKKLTKMI